MEKLRDGGLTADDKQLIWDDIHALQDKKNDLSGRIAVLNEQIESEAYSLEQIEQIKSSIATFPRLMEIATYEQTIELIKKIVSFIAVKHNDTTGDDDVHIVLRGAEDTVNFNLARERSVMFHSGIDSILHAAGCVGGQPRAFGPIEGLNALNEPHRTDGNQILLVGRLSVVLLHNVGDQPEIALNEHIPGGDISLDPQIQIVPFFFGGQRPGERPGLQLQRVQKTAEHQPNGCGHTITS